MKKQIRTLAFISASLAVILGAPTIAQNQDSASDPNREAGLTAWGKVHEVFSHPRCANCHVADGHPRWSGEHYGTTRIHGMNIGGNPDNLLGENGLLCTTCHMPENSSKLHGPPGAEVWHLPPKEMAWWDKSSTEICEQVKDPARNGNRSLDDLVIHVAEDKLVAWGWAPGPGREAAPYSASETAEALRQWAQNGAPCPPR